MLFLLEIIDLQTYFPFTGIVYSNPNTATFVSIHLNLLNYQF
jgi:hypothetical protein